MKLSRLWLNKYIDLSDISDQDIFLRLTMTTAEFEHYHFVNSHLGDFITGEVLNVSKHPDADKLSLTKVNIGDRQLDIVCGASNVAVGQIVPVALPGVTLPSGLKIKKSKIRSQVSEGMICSKEELALESSSSGIWVLPPETPISQPLNIALNLMADTIFEIDNKSITHRPDLWNHLGFARELSAIYDRPLQMPIFEPLALDTNPEISIQVENADDCPRYCGLIIEGMQIGKSPEWLQRDLEAVGLRSINNIVDITNYIMLEMGEPLHAFDKDRLRGTTIFIRRAKSSESITTLDSKSHNLTEHDLVIADASGPIALAGVMGGELSEVTSKTSTIFLEAANFYASRIRKTANRFNLKTDAAQRFEKSLDPNIASQAIWRAWHLIKQICPTAYCRNYVDVYGKKLQSKNLTLKHETIEKRLGIDVSAQQVVKILNSLGLLTKQENTEYSVDIPTWRATKDLAIQEDIIEEIGRVIGYDNIKPKPPFVPLEVVKDLPFRKFEHRIRQIMSGACDSDEVYLYSFYGKQLLEQCLLTQGGELRLQNYLSDEMDRLRIDLMPGLIKSAAQNLRYFPRFRSYEIGRVYIPTDDHNLAQEQTWLGYVSVEAEDIDTPFYIARHQLDKLLASLGVLEYRLSRSASPAYLHPGRAARIIIQQHSVGFIGELHPRVAQNFDIKKRAVLFSLNLNQLFNISQENVKKFVAPAKFPPAYFEISVLADLRCEIETMTEILTKGDIEFLRQVRLLAVYEGENIPSGKKSVSLGLTFVDENDTISAERIKSLREKAVFCMSEAGFALKA